MNNIKVVLSVFIIFISTACSTTSTTSTTSTANIYNPKHIAINKLASIEGRNADKTDLTKDDVTRILYVYDRDGNELTGRDVNSGEIHKMSLPEGEYFIKAECFNKKHRVELMYTFLLEESKRYQVYCYVEVKDESYLYQAMHTFFAELSLDELEDNVEVKDERSLHQEIYKVLADPSLDK